MHPTITPESARLLALTRLGETKYTPDHTAMGTLRKFPWITPIDQFPDHDTNQGWNLELDPRSCLTKAALGVALMEKHFPNCEIELGEVLDDGFRRVMLERIRQAGLPTDPKIRTEWLVELLVYEEPHVVLFVNSRQFDPAWVTAGRDFQHGDVRKHPSWQFVAAARTIAQIKLSTPAEERLQLLDQADALCPNVIAFLEQRAVALFMQERNDESASLMAQCLQKRTTARGLFMMWLATGDNMYRLVLQEAYTISMFDHLADQYSAAILNSM